ncbi:MAG: YebC/PmpR family DNA-binding regulatory protein [Thermoproteota archaeon]|jgi:YebC/PmpR family DNA-binding regulatory protein
MGRKSAKIANKKGAADKQRSVIYNRALRDVTIACKNGSTDVETNFLLKVAIERCKKFNVPKDNIDRAVKKAAGGDGAGYEDITYEGYGPGGVAIFVEASTNNVTRTVANVRMHFNKNGGAMGKDGSLQFIFERKAVFIIPIDSLDEDDFTLEMIDAGAEDIERDEDIFEVIGPMEAFGDIQVKLQELKITPEEANLQRIALTHKEVTDETFLLQVEKITDALEDDDDVVSVYNNIEVKEN